MAEESYFPPSPTNTNELQPDKETEDHVHENQDLLGDIVLWRRKQLNLIILSAATAAWTAMEVYQYNFITILSYVAMATVLILFLWGNIHRLLKKEAPDLSGMEISESMAMEMATSFRQAAEKGIRMMFHVSAEREWFVFAGAVASLYLLSLLAACMDLFTLCYIGLIGGMTVPVIYVKNQQRIRQYGEGMKMKACKLYEVVKKRFLKMKDYKMAGKQKQVKDKKME